MSSFTANLRPHERRLLFVVLAVVFVVINVALVWPRFGDWEEVRAGLEKARQKRAEYQAEIDRIRTYQRQIRELEGQGSAVLPEAQALDLLRTIQAKAREARVIITQTRAATPVSAASRTNSFFSEQAINIVITTGTEELIDFLYAIGTGPSMIRVRDMNLTPDTPHYKLVGKLTLVASYQKQKTRGARGSRKPRVASSSKP
jgi:Tfp pilus assembly protein PilO